MPSDYNYDENGQFFPFFILTLTSLVTLPLTYNVLKKNEEIENTAPRIKSGFKPKHADLIQGQQRAQKRREFKTKRTIAVVLGYLVMTWMVYKIIVTKRIVPKIWDPYEILGLSRSASEKAIKKHKRLASLRFHPDKARPDPSKNETMELLNDRWVDMTKAYSALLDEDVRNNWMQYGHPDGKQSFSIGIALPKLMVTQGNGKYVLLFYALILGVALPYVVGKWWYGTQALTKDGVLIASAGRLFKEFKDDVTTSDVVAATSKGEEFQQVLASSKADVGLGQIEKSVVSADAGSSKQYQQQLKKIDDPLQRRALALLWAYLARTDLGDAALESEKYAVAPVAFLLNDSFTSIALAFGVVAPLLASYHASQHIIQALLPDASPLLQLPHFTPKMVRTIEGDSSRARLSIQKFMSLPNSTRRRLAADLSDLQYATAMQVAQQMPHFVVAKAYFKVVGDKVVTPSALVQLVVKGRIIPPGSKNIPEVNPSDLEDVDPEEGDLDALLGRRSAKSRRKQPIDMNDTSTTVGSENSKEKPIQPPLAHAPYFARDHSPRWRVFLTDARAGRIGVPPFTFTEFERPIFLDAKDIGSNSTNDDDDEKASSSSNNKNSNKPTFNMQTLKCQFQAPPQVGQFAFKMHLICDSYVGFDSTVDIILDVQDMSKAVPPAVLAREEEGDDISEPDEDSLAGQMAAMKGGVGKKQGSKRGKKVEKEEVEKKTSVGDKDAGDGKDDEEEEEDDEDDESDTDGEVQDTSDTDTETDEE